jgi:hypothetical protein
MSKANKSPNEPTAPENMSDEAIPFVPLHDEGDEENDEQYVIPLHHPQSKYRRVSPPKMQSRAGDLVLWAGVSGNRRSYC